MQLPISVIMPSFNVEPFIRQSIESLLLQTFSDFELLIIDDGSTDLTPVIIEEYKSRDSRIRSFSLPRKGLSAARNFGVTKANGSYIYFFDSDDLLEKDALLICMKYISELQLDLIAFAGRSFSDDVMKQRTYHDYVRPNITIPKFGDELLSELISADLYVSSACLYIFSKKLLDNFYLKFDEGYIHEDEGFTPLLFCSAKRAISIDKCLFNRRIRPHSIMTTDRSIYNIEGLVQAIKKMDIYYNSDKNITKLGRKTLRLRQRSILNVASNSSWDIGVYKEFLTLLKSRLKLRRLYSIDPKFFLYNYGYHAFYRLRALKRRLKLEL